MFSFKTITKNGSILGRIPHKSSSSSLNMSNSNSDITDYYLSGSDDSAGSNTYTSGRSPRAAPPRSSSSSSREGSIRTTTTTTTTTTTSSSGGRIRSGLSVAIAEYRSHTIPPPRFVREDASLGEDTRSSRPIRDSGRGEAAAPRSRFLSTRRARPNAPSPRRRNPADFSDSDSSFASSWSSRGSSAGERSQLAPVARDFLESSRRAQSSPEQGGKDSKQPVVGAAVEGESFFPNPKVTFLIDEPRNLTCQICLVEPLSMAERADRAGEKAPVILPCGHVACAGCMDSWLGEHHSCPFCRLAMVHEACGHAVQPRVVAHDTLLALPRTTAEGGRVGTRCRDCKVEVLRADALAQWKGLARDLRAARAADQERSTPETRAALKLAEKAFETAPSRSSAELSARVGASW